MEDTICARYEVKNRNETAAKYIITNSIKYLYILLMLTGCNPSRIVFITDFRGVL